MLTVVGVIPIIALHTLWLKSHTRTRMIFLYEEGFMEAAVAVPGSGTLLGSISDFCRRTGMAESTFGRRAVNDGKFVARLRDGARVTPETLHRVNDFMTKHGASGAGEAPPELMALISATSGARPAPATA